MNTTLITLSNSFRSVSIIFLLTSIGYFCGAKGWMNKGHKAFLSKLIMNIGLPCMCLNNLTKFVTKDLVLESIQQILVPLIGIPILFLLSLLLAKLLKLPHRQIGPFAEMCGLSNAIFIGYSMCLELFGEASASSVMLFYLVNTFYAQSVGMGLIEYSGRSEASLKLKNILDIFRRPVMVALLLAFLLIWWELPLPSILVSTTSYLGNTVSPLGLLSTGFIIYEIGLKNLRLTKGLSVMLLVRFTVAPVLCLVLCSFFGIHGLARSVVTMEMAMPCITQVVVASTEYGADDQFAAQGAALSTLLCFIVTPVLMLLL